jgi:hypothetical protein
MTHTEIPQIHVSEQAWAEISPRAALVHVTLSADRLFSGRAALEKAGELRKLVVALRERAIPESSIALEGASLDVSTGLFSKSSSVTYRVRIAASADKLPEVLEVIAAAKQANLTNVEWDYPVGPTDELVAECTLEAAARGRHIAATLGVAIGRVHRVEVTPIDDGYADPTSVARGGYRMRLSSMATELSGIELAPTKKIGVRVAIAYALSADTPL